jgi:hypothetical protein
VADLVGALRRWRLPLIAGAAAVAVVVILGYLLYFPSAPTLPPYGGPPPISDDRVQGADLIFSYTANAGNHNASGYLTPPPECDGCPFNATPGTEWVFSFNLTNNGSATHEVESISVVAPFVLDSVGPALPVPLSAKSTQTFTLTLTLPTSPGYYFLDGSIAAY